MIGVAVLGSTGSIGTSTLDVLRRHPDRFRVVALAANSSADALWRQVREFRPEYAVLVDRQASRQLRQHIKTEGLTTQVLDGADALESVASLSQVDAVMAAIVGAAGLRSALAAAISGKRVLLANKESLVVAGQLFMDAVEQHQATLLPIDSEHNAIFQCMPADRDKAGVRRILLTASGGPFRSATLPELEQVTPEQACAHPNWDMGKKISVDSATMMNKGLEVIEAHWLFDLTPAEIQVVVHPQSVIHSMVEYVDGSVLAQMGNPDMRTPIAHALAWPERIDSGVASLDLFEVARLDFRQPDVERFPCLRLAYEAVAAGGVMPAVLNAANEVAVDAFLEERIPFVAIPRLNQAVMESAEQAVPQSIDHLLEVDRRSRREAEQIMLQLI
ncbi:MAG: 1-deoxy-D-xylulose-5-phosphate reductoisomerase [Pseudomonadota bacterium]